mgnify:CR=1 FL=1
MPKNRKLFPANNFLILWFFEHHFPGEGGRGKHEETSGKRETGKGGENVFSRGKKKNFR